MLHVTATRGIEHQPSISHVSIFSLSVRAPSEEHTIHGSIVYIDHGWSIDKNTNWKPLLQQIA